jgi:ATP-dependent helicase STH1/SNF2
MNRLYTEVNAMKSDVGEDLNTYFLKPVDRKMYPDYYQVISNPISMAQIKRKIGNASYTLPQLRSDMHLLWNNARTYNQEGSWVYNAAEDMQEAFDRMWEEEVGKVDSASASVAPTGNGNGNGLKADPETAGPSAAASGTSTPMYKPATAIPTKIKLSVTGPSKRREQIEMDSPTPSGSDGDDDY